MLDPVALQPGEIEAVEDAQRQQELKGLARWRQRVDGEAAVVRGQRLFPCRLDRLEVAEREASAEFRQMRNDHLAERAAVEVARSVARKCLQCARQVRLANDLPERHRRRPTGVVLRPVVIERGLGPQQRDVLVELGHAELGQREAVAGQADRRLQRVLQRLPAVRAHELGPARQIAGRADREGAVPEILAPREALDRQPGGNRRHEVEHAHLLLCRHVAGRIAEAREAGHEGLDDIECGCRCRRGVERIAAARQQLGAGLRGQRMGGRDDAVQRRDGWTLAMHVVVSTQTDGLV